MCGSDELIHDTRQITLEEMIMTNETPMYLVPGRLTDDQAKRATEGATRALALGREACIADYIIHAIGTPIQPCADVDTVGYGREASFSDLKGDGCHGVSIHKEWDGGIPLVRRTDMDAQVARVAAEKDAEIDDIKAFLRPVLTNLDYAAHELEQTEAAQSVHQLAHICLSLLSDEESIRQSALAELTALNEGAAG
ncbi:hypothetical protein [Komagataeibacter europaeus]|uniref:hypothetical protein n=1 Tax=Komagataeibacter europaeus TaxID=33995 RepID=UPI000369520D|nr:hypothetical protein [Komagataeibacter europaeus]